MPNRRSSNPGSTAWQQQLYNPWSNNRWTWNYLKMSSSFYYLTHTVTCVRANNSCSCQCFTLTRLVSNGGIKSLTVLGGTCTIDQFVMYAAADAPPTTLPAPLPTTAKAAFSHPFWSANLEQRKTSHPFFNFWKYVAKSIRLLTNGPLQISSWTVPINFAVEWRQSFLIASHISSASNQSLRICFRIYVFICLALHLNWNF